MNLRRYKIFEVFAHTVIICLETIKLAKNTICYTCALNSRRYEIFEVLAHTVLQKQQERVLPCANLCLAIFACQHNPFLLTFFSLSILLYTDTLNISFVHHFSSIAQSETPSLRAFPREKRLLLLTQLNS